MNINQVRELERKPAENLTEGELALILTERLHLHTECVVIGQLEFLNLQNTLKKFGEARGWNSRG